MTFFHVNLLDYIAQIVPMDAINRLQFSINDSWNKLSEFLVHKVYPSENNAVIETDNVIMLMNYKTDTESVLNIEPIKFHDIEVTTNYVAQKSEKETN